MTVIGCQPGKLAPFGSIAVAAMLIVAALPVDALAAVDSPDWRPTFDLVMRWVNFLILFFVIVKFARAPIKSFLQGRKEEIDGHIDELEEQKKKIVLEIDQGQKMLENSRERLSRLKKKILAEGEKSRQKIITAAENESRLMLKNAGQKMSSRIQDAKNDLKAELVDLAVSIAIRHLPAQMTAEDNQKYIDRFLAETAEK